MIPTVDCYDTGTQYEFYCKYCSRKHMHGKSEGHRIAHCSTLAESPYTKTGYILRLAQ